MIVAAALELSRLIIGEQTVGYYASLEEVLKLKISLAGIYSDVINEVPGNSNDYTILYYLFILLHIINE